MADTKITALYCRVACEDDGEIALQEAVLREYALKQGYSNICTYADNGYIGRDFNRPAFSRMALDIQSGLVSAILVKDISRISRQHPDFIKWIGGIRQKGVAFISVTDGLTEMHFAAGYMKALQATLP